MENNISQAFKNNYYQTIHFAKFCQKITNHKLKTLKLNNKSIYILKNKNISIANYDKKTKNYMINNKIFFMNLLYKKNNNQTLYEYSLVPKYNKKEYDSSFKKGLKQSQNYDLETTIKTTLSKQELYEIYEIYKNQMMNLNSFIFSLSYFEEFLKLKHSMIFMIKYKNKIISYGFCIKYKDNLYASIGGADRNYQKLRPTNKIYDEVINYKIKNKLNLHLGLGIYNSGFSKFKQKVGAINLALERFPNDEKLLKLIMLLTKFKIVGKLFRWKSIKYPNQVHYISMPFT